MNKIKRIKNQTYFDENKIFKRIKTKINSNNKLDKNKY